MDEETRRELFGKWLGNRLSDKGWTQTDLARRIPYGTSAISKWVNGEVSPSPHAIVAIAEAFQLAAETVLLAVVEPDRASATDAARPQLPPNLSELEVALISAHAFSQRDVMRRQAGKRDAQTDEEQLGRARTHPQTRRLLTET